MRVYFLALGTLLIVCVGCAVDGQQMVHKGEYHAPPAEMLAHPGPMVGGPGPGVMNFGAAPPVMQAAAMAYMPSQAPAMPRTSQVRFLGPEGMSIGWQIGQGFAENQMTAPDRYNFNQAATYRLKLASIPGREGLTVYPSLHVYPVQPQTAAYLEHNPLPVRITDEDLDQVETNNFVTKVIYLPDARYQEQAIAGVEELVSTRLTPGIDPVSEADRRGTIMAVIRMGNIDLEMPGPMGMSAGQPGSDGQSQIAQVDGEIGQFVAPQAISDHLGGGMMSMGGGVPHDMLMGGPAGPGQPPFDPIVGVNAPMYGYPTVGTPIGLVGPPHIPLGRPAGMQSHTVRNLTDFRVAGPPKDVLVDVKHNPGISLPDPVSYIYYEETHPVYQQGELSQPKWAQ